MSDQELFAGLKSGDRKSVNQLYAQFFPSVKRWISSNSGNEADACDVFQDCLETILLKVDTLNHNLGGLIMLICKRKWIDKVRKKTRTTKVINEESLRQVDENVEEQITKYEEDYLRHQILDEAFGKLSGLCQKLLALIKQGRTTGEIQGELSFSTANTIYRRKSACMERWTEYVKQDPRYSSIY